MIKRIIKKEFKLIIEIDEIKLKEKYQNFSINYNADNFITSIAMGLNENQTKYGYKIIVKPEKGDDFIFESFEDWAKGQFFPSEKKAKRIYNIKKQCAFRIWQAK